MFRNMSTMLDKRQIWRDASPVQLRVQVARILELIPRCWGADTAHSSSAGLSGLGLPVGQCYVTSMLVCEHTTPPRGIDGPFLCRGSVYKVGSDRPLIDDHGWVEWQSRDCTYITDLTLSQVAGFQPIVLRRLASTGMDYRLRDCRKLPQVVSDDAWTRYFRLSARFIDLTRSEQPCLI